MVRCHIANAIAGRLDGVHLDLRQRLQNVRNIAQFRPVILDVLTRGKMAITLVPALRNIGQLPHLGAVQSAVGHCDAQHIGV